MSRAKPRRPGRAPGAAANRRLTDFRVVATSIDDDRPRCRRCRHPLTSYLAVEAGFGPTCAMYILGNAPRRARERFIGQATLPGLEAVA